MGKPHLRLVGYDKWGNHVSKRVLTDKGGRKYVLVSNIGSPGRKKVPCAQFRNETLRYSFYTTE